MQQTEGKSRMSNDTLSLRWIVRALAAHWRTNPAASDSAEGIRRWWFPTEKAVAADELGVALAWMQGRALIEALSAADRRVRYRRIAGDEQFDSLVGDEGLGPVA
jgi:hypothetical protein